MFLAFQILVAFVPMAVLSRLALLGLRWWRKGGRLRIILAHAVTVAIAAAFANDALIGLGAYVAATAFMLGVDLARYAAGLPEISGPILKPEKPAA